LYTVYASVLTSVLGTDKLRRALGLALLNVAQKLTPVIARGKPD
jgi:hypothetical protein